MVGIKLIHVSKRGSGLSRFTWFIYPHFQWGFIRNGTIAPVPVVRILHHWLSLSNEREFDTNQQQVNVDCNMITSSNGKIFRVLAICVGNLLVTGEFPAQRPVILGLLRCMGSLKAISHLTHILNFNWQNTKHTLQWNPKTNRYN